MLEFGNIMWMVAGSNHTQINISVVVMNYHRLGCSLQTTWSKWILKDTSVFKWDSISYGQHLRFGDQMTIPAAYINGILRNATWILPTKVHVLEVWRINGWYQRFGLNIESMHLLSFITCITHHCTWETISATRACCSIDCETSNLYIYYYVYKRIIYI